MWTLAALRRSRSVALLLAHRFHGHHQLWTLAALRSSLNVALLLAHRFLHGNLHLWTLAAPRTSPSAVLLLAEWLLHRRLCCCHQPWRTRTTSLHVPYLSRALPGLQRSASWRCMWMNQRMSLKRASCSRRTVVSFGTGACHVEVFCPVGCMWLGSLEWFHRCRDTACDEGGFLARTPFVLSPAKDIQPRPSYSHALMEVFSTPRLVPVAAARGLLAQHSLDKDSPAAWQADCAADRERARELVRSCRPYMLMLSPECTMYSIMQRNTNLGSIRSCGISPASS